MGYQVKTSLLSALATNTAPTSLQVHNKYRALHHSPPLNWSEGLANEASRIAQSLATQATLSGKKDSALNLGQNLAKLAGKWNADINLTNKVQLPVTGFQL